jgi:predicted RNase H-like HicB family nuclease
MRLWLIRVESLVWLREFGMVTIGKDVDEAFESMKKMIDEYK